MGGGASLIEGVEELMTTTILIGRAISSMPVPGMYRIYDFHSKKAPRLRNAKQFTFFGPDSDEEDGAESSDQVDPEVYTKFFKTTVNGEEIYLEDPLAENDSGWTPLHTCCMGMATVSAGMALIEEILLQGGSLEIKTKLGPGTFNKGWTPLQMACGYGVEPLVEALVERGANVNATNCYGFSCLHEACHRGFSEIVRHLLKGPIDLSYIPTDEETSASPFSSAPAQAALAEAARCGFYKIVQVSFESLLQFELNQILIYSIQFNIIDLIRCRCSKRFAKSFRLDSSSRSLFLSSIRDCEDIIISRSRPNNSNESWCFTLSFSWITRNEKYVRKYGWSQSSSRSRRCD
jgi:hypothetical protein